MSCWWQLFAAELAMSVLCLHYSSSDTPSQAAKLNWSRFGLKAQANTRPFGWHPPQPMTAVARQRIEQRTGTLVTSSCCGAAGGLRRSAADGQRKWWNGANRQAATSGEFPWAAALVFTAQSVPICGGSVINDQYVLTNAYCALLATASVHQLLLGEYNLQATSGNEMRKTITDKFTHPSYQAFFNQYNVGLIKFTTPLVLSTSSTIKPVCMPSAGYILLLGLLTATGWGTTAQASTQYAILQKYPLFVPPVMPFCEWFIPIPFNIIVRTSNFCAFRSVFFLVVRNSSTSGDRSDPEEPLGYPARLNDSAYQQLLEAEYSGMRNVLAKFNLMSYRKKSQLEAKKLQNRLGSCNGDIGSALMSYSLGRYEATGLIVDGWACNLFTPGLYSHVGYSYDWIIASTTDATYC